MVRMVMVGHVGSSYFIKVHLYSLEVDLDQEMLMIMSIVAAEGNSVDVDRRTVPTHRASVKSCG